MQQNLSGLMSQMAVGSPFIRSNLLRSGLEQKMYGKEPVVVSTYRVEIFDMSDPARRSEYEKLMLDLMPKVQDAECVVSKNELQVLTTGSGTGWWRYVEWFEYKLNDKSLTTGSDDTGNGTDDEEHQDDRDDDSSNIY